MRQIRRGAIHCARLVSNVRRLTAEQAMAHPDCAATVDGRGARMDENVLHPVSSPATAAWHIKN